MCLFDYRISFHSKNDTKSSSNKIDCRMKRDSSTIVEDNSKRQKISHDHQSSKSQEDVNMKDVTLPISMEEIEFHREILQRKHQTYCKFLVKEENVQSSLKEMFWNLVVITASDEAQREYYESQLRDRIDRNEIPSFVKYHVISDPIGPKFGSGGSTMLVLDFLQKTYPNEIANCMQIIF